VYDAVTDFNFRGLGFSVRPIMNDASSIKLPESSTDDTSQAIYDLQGRLLRHAPAKGVYIQDGKKRVVK